MIEIKLIIGKLFGRLHFDITNVEIKGELINLKLLQQFFDDNDNEIRTVSQKLLEGQKKPFIMKLDICDDYSAYYICDIKEVDDNVL